MQPEEWTEKDLEMTMQLERITAENATRQMERIRQEDIRLYQMRKRAEQERAVSQQVPHIGGTSAAGRRRKADWLVYTGTIIGMSLLIYLLLLAAGNQLAANLAEPARFFGVELSQKQQQRTQQALSLVAPAFALLTAYIAMWLGMHGTPLPLKANLRMPREKAVWLLIPAFVGLSFILSIITSAFQAMLRQITVYRQPPEIKLPNSGTGVLLYLIGLCVLPAVLEEVFLRGAVQQVLGHWGPWFAASVTAMVSVVMGNDFARGPEVFVQSFLLGLTAYCTGSVAICIYMRLAASMLMFAFMASLQFMQGVSSFAFSVYLIVLVFAVGGGATAAAVKLNIAKHFRALPYVYESKSRRSRLERLCASPMFIILMVTLTVRLMLPLFVVN